MSARAPNPQQVPAPRAEDEHPGEGELSTCPTCGGGLTELGRLGKIRWTRCRACGLVWSID